jgi:hypothetical protein
METGPARKKLQSPAHNSSAQSGATGKSAFTYLFVQRFEREERAQAAGQKIAAMDLPFQVTPKTWGSRKFFVVFCGPIEAKKVSSVTQLLEGKGFSNVRNVGDLTGNRNAR